MAAIVVDESLMRAGIALADLVLMPTAYRVVNGALTLDGAPVDLGYEATAIGAVERMRSGQACSRTVRYGRTGVAGMDGKTLNTGGHQRVGLAGTQGAGARSRK